MLKNRSVSFVLLEFLIILVYLNPIADLFSSYIQIIVFILWILFMVNNKAFFGEALPFTVLNILIFIFSLIRCIFANQINTDYYSTFQIVIARYQMMIYPILYIYVKRLNKEKKRTLFNLAIFSIVGTILVSLYYILFVDPQAIRNTQRSVPLFGVGDFMLMYAMAISVGPIFFFIIKRIKDGKRSIGYILSFLLIIICLLLCNLVTSVVIAAISLFVMYIVSRNNKSMISILCIMSILLYIIKSNIAQLFYFIASKNLFYWSTNNKIIAIANVLNGDMTNIDTLSRRFMLASWSINSFKEHFLFGINWKNQKYGVIGCHMQWADDLGRFGVIGNLLFLIDYLYMFNYMKQHTLNTFVKNSIVTVWIMFFILGFLNPCLSATNLMMMFVIIPSMDGFFDYEME